MTETQTIEAVGEPLELICVGNALVDIFVKVDKEAFKHIGAQGSTHIEYADLISLLDRFPVNNVVSGGGAANVAKIAALLGIHAGYIGSVGQDDEFAAAFESDMMASSAEIFLAKESIPTGLCLFLQCAGEPPVIAASISAAACLDARDVREDAIQRARVVAVDGYILGRSALVNRILDLAAQYGTVVALDAGSVEMTRAHAQDILRYCREYPLILFMNQDEAEAFYHAASGDTNADEEEDTSFMSRLLRKNPLPPKMQTFFQKLANDLFPVIAVKLGSKGAVVFAGGKMFREDTLAVIPRETTGAGDAFCAAFLAAWLRDRSFADCAEFGNKTAREILDVDGTLVDKKKMSALARQLAD
jgi:sugar/nucleoside kinase (ribokinase family)